MCCILGILFLVNCIVVRASRIVLLIFPVFSLGDCAGGVSLLILMSVVTFRALGCLIVFSLQF